MVEPRIEWRQLADNVYVGEVDGEDHLLLLLHREQWILFPLGAGLHFDTLPGAKMWVKTHTELTSKP